MELPDCFFPMPLPIEFDTAVMAAAYLSSRAAYPKAHVAISNTRVLNVNGTEAQIPTLAELADYWSSDNSYRLRIGADGVYLNVNENGSFGIEAGDNKDSQDLQSRVYITFKKTGFTPVDSFRRSNERQLKTYGFLFNEQRWSQHIDSLMQRFPDETMPYLDKARKADINKVSAIYLDKLVERDYSRWKRAGKLAVCAAGIYALSALAPETIEAAKQLYSYYLSENGILSTVVTNALTMPAFYGIGDAAAQYIEGRGFNARRFKRTVTLAAIYGAEFTGVYWLIGKATSAINKLYELGQLANAFTMSVMDVPGYGACLFNPRHVYLMTKQAMLNPLDYIRVDKFYIKLFKDAAFRKKWVNVTKTAPPWLAYQTWNRAAHPESEWVFWVALAAVPFAVYLSLVSNEKKELHQFQDVMANIAPNRKVL